MIDPRRLGVLQAVAVHGSVAGAADALHLTPPAVSQQLLALERETGASLIDRSGRQVRLTAAGRLLAAHGERVAAQLRQAEQDLAELTGQASGPVRIAAFQSVMAPLIGPALRDLAAASPAIQPVITERYGPAAVADLRVGNLDIVLTEYDAASPPPAEPGLGLRHLAFDPYLLVIPPDWQVRPRSLRDLAGRPWVAGPPGTACDHALRRLAAEAAIAVPAGDVCVEFPSVLALVAAGRGAAVIPRITLGQAPVTVCAVPPLGGRHIAAWHQAGPARPAPATATVLDTLAQSGEALRQAPLVIRGVCGACGARGNGLRGGEGARHRGGLRGEGTAPAVVILAAVNEEHLAICSSPEWARFVEDDLLPWVLGGYDLGDDLLEVGPGPGLTTDILRRHAARVTAAELDPSLAAKLAARLAGSNVEVVRADATRLPFATGRFSAAACLTMLHHIPSAELQDAALAELARVLRSGGVLVGTDGLDTPERRRKHIGDIFVPVDPGTFPERLRRAGFADARVEVGADRWRFAATSAS